MEKYYIAALCTVNQLGVKRVQALIRKFGSAKNVWNMSNEDLKISGLPTSVFEALINLKIKNPDCPEKIMEFCESKDVGLCSIVDEDYPPILKEIQSPPPVFYYRGILQTNVERIGMVGTRNSTQYGAKVAFEIAAELSAAGVTIVSGAARGIDTHSHRGALKNGRTVAVLGCGINFVFPRENKKLLDEIAESGGLVMTEFEPNQSPNATTFPPRNRIIAGLSRGVIVVEAGKKSGALITSDFAGDYGREVFAVPGSIFSPVSAGCHEIIKDGAKLITNAQDVFDFFKIQAAEDETEKVPQKIFVELEGDEKKIFDVIPAGEFITTDEILDKVEDIESSEISQHLLNLQLKKLIVEDSGRYSRS